MAACPKCGNRMSKVAGQPQTCRRHGPMRNLMLKPQLAASSSQPSALLEFLSEQLR